MEGVSLPQILVTLTPLLANAMLMAEPSDTGWELSDDGKLTVTGAYVRSFEISSWSAVQSIEVTANATFVLSQGTSFSGSITVQADGELENSAGGTLSGNITLQGGSLNNYGALTGSVTIEAGGEMFNSIGGTISSCDITVKAGGKLDNSYDATLSCDVTVETDGYFDNNGVISGGEISGEVSNYGTITGGDFTGATVENNGGTITGGTFAGYTISVIDSKLTLTITGQNFDLTKIDLESFELAQVVVAEGASVADADVKNLSGVAFVNNGEIISGTFAGIVYLRNSGTITGGTFNAYLINLASVTGATINGTIDNFGTITGCTFGDSASVQTNRGAIYVTMTVNGLDVTTFKHGENILSALETKFGKGKWYAVVDGEQKEIPEDATFGLQKQSYACAYYTEGTTLYITAPTSVTEEMLAGVSLVIVTETGEIKGGTFACRVYNMGAISGGTFEGLVNNRGTISGGTFKSRVENYQGGVISGGMFNAGTTVSNLEGSITGGVFTDAIMENGDGTITGGVFRDFTMNS